MMTFLMEMLVGIIENSANYIQSATGRTYDFAIRPMSFRPPPARPA